MDIKDPSFNVVEFINSSVTNENNFHEFFKNTLGKLRQVQMTSDTEMGKYRNQYREKDPHSNLDQEFSMLVSWYGKIVRRVEKGEVIVETIMKEIYEKDMEKKRLEETITVLNRFSLFKQSINQLDQFLRKGHNDYVQVSQMLAAINQLGQFFQPYQSVEEVDDLFQKQKVILGKLRAIVVREFDTSFHNRWKGCCLVIDQLDRNLIQVVRDKVIKQELDKYQKEFNLTLESIPNRYAWMKRLIKRFQSSYGQCFPKSWCVPQELVVEFCLVTRNIIETILSDKRPHLDATLLHKSMRATLDFENLMTHHFKQFETQSKYQFHGFISPCFETDMEISYVLHEDQTMGEYMRSILKKEKNMSTQKTAEDIFISIQQSFKNCIAFSKGKILNSLINKVWKKYLAMYGKHLGAIVEIQCNPPVNISVKQVFKLNFLKDAFMGTQPTNEHILPPENIQALSKILQIAHYCQDEIDGVEEILESTIDDEFTVDLSKEKSHFLHVIKNIRDALVRHLRAFAEIAFLVMSKRDWNVDIDVTDCSEFIHEFMNSIVEQLHHFSLPDNYYKSIIEGFGYPLSHIYKSFLFRCVKISPTGSQQMLLDLMTAKNFAEELLPSNRYDDEERERYQSKLRKRFQHVEKFLKVLQTTGGTNNVLQMIRKVFGKSLSQARTVDELATFLEIHGDLSKIERSAVINALRGD